jgi:hypothetical protein
MDSWSTKILNTGNAIGPANQTLLTMKMKCSDQGHDGKGLPGAGWALKKYELAGLI